MNSEKLFTKAIVSLKEFSEGKPPHDEKIVAAMEKLQTFYYGKSKNLFSSSTFTLKYGVGLTLFAVIKII